MKKKQNKSEWLDELCVKERIFFCWKWYNDYEWGMSNNVRIQDTVL